MTSIEIAFLFAIFALYLSDCIYWVGPGEQAFTRLSTSEWKAWRIEAMSFTLLGKMPILVAPFLIRPGFIWTRATEAAPTDRALRKVDKRLDRMYLLLALCRAQAFFLLVYLPLLIALHRLTPLWPIFLSVLMAIHVTLSCIVIRALRRSKSISWFTAASSIALNPLGATRAFDTISQAFFDQELISRKARTKQH